MSDRLEIGGGPNPRVGWLNLDPIFGRGGWRRRLQDGIPTVNASLAAVRAEHCLEHIPSAERIDAMNEVWRALRPGGTFEIIVPLFPSWQAIADPTHQSYWVRESFAYFSGEWWDTTWMGIRQWRWATTAESASYYGVWQGSWFVDDENAGHALLVKP